MSIDARTRNIIIAAVAIVIVVVFAVLLRIRSRPATDLADLDSGEGVVVTATVEITSTVAAQAANAECVNHSAFVADVTIPDGTQVKQSESLRKIWRIRNTGTCAWNSNYSIQFAGGTQLGGADLIPLPGDVAPGEEIEIGVALTTPDQAGRFQGQWRTADANGTFFGQTIYYEIVVEGTPAIRFFAASKYLIRVGEEVVLSWGVDNAYEGAFLAINGAEQPVGVLGSTVIKPDVTSTYELIARNAENETRRRLSIFVSQVDSLPTPTADPGVLPIIHYFRTDRYELTRGEEAVLSWNLEGAYDGAYLIGGGAEEGVVAPGIKRVSPEETTVYRLVARNGAGESAREVTVVVQAPAAEPTTAPESAAEPTATPATAEEAPTATPETVEEATATPESAQEPTATPASAEPTATSATEVEPTATQASAEEPTATPESAEEPTASPEPAADTQGTINDADAGLREAPSSDSNVVTTATAGTTVQLVGRTQDGAWLQIQLPDGANGWVETSSLSTDLDVSTLPVTDGSS